MTSVIPDVPRLVNDIYHGIIDKNGRNNYSAPPEVAVHLNKKLIDNGWEKDTDIHSMCSKAIHEYNLKKDGMKVNIVASCFMGYFIDVSVRR